MCHVQVTGGRNGYGAKLANIFSTEFVIETCDGKRQRQYRQASHSLLLLKKSMRFFLCCNMTCNLGAQVSPDGISYVQLVSEVWNMDLQVFRNNMSVKEEPVIKACKASDNWTCVTFKPDLAKFGMSILEEQTVSLMRKRVHDLAGVLGKTVKVWCRVNEISIKEHSDISRRYMHKEHD